ncbi:carbohydrate ABC transporter permease [Alkalibacillus haloalkaliphilus]|uniref:Sugar ABC transporter permease n=1 Tax=Alkalibacillus haloalkaliphilus TaxID=94136 RepID=A0A511W3C6_9BACI|nr:carbohydrate ABC transporter permease [Alkalibacillus haloalkaliphilus]MDV2581516.1 carbohydrate ABC transporter permease [Alkalibacillus haloalkaliphilus]GEN44593.1 sugar ABC transporter permease [Alkalibacillus haloalkaliphilus]
MKWKKWRLELLGVLLGLIWIAPFYLMFVNSFKTQRELFEGTLNLPSSLDFSNYIEAFQEMNFLQTLFNSVLVTGFSIVIIIFFSAMAAYALARTKSKVSTVILFIFISAMLIPFQSVMIPLVSLFGEIDLLNRGGLIFMYLGFGSSLSIFLYHGAMNNIPETLDEAARIDGANKFQIFWYIIFPMLKPITVTVGILNTIWIWNDYLLPSLVINSPGSETIPLRMFYFFGQYTTQWHLAMAGLTLAILPVIIGYFFAQRAIIKGVTDGAVK